MQPPILFDHALHRLRHARVRRESVAPILDDMTERLSDRLRDITRSFAQILLLGAGEGRVEQAVRALYPQAEITFGDGRQEMLPYEPGSFDAVLSCAALHRINDVPGLLAQIRRVLRPDGLFLALFPGGRTLHELRAALEESEIRLCGGVSPRVHPFIDVRDGGALLLRAGFALPVADGDLLTLRYASLLPLLRDLRAAGETNTLIARNKSPLPRRFWPEASLTYERLWRGPDGRIPATLEWITLTGWAPHASQPKPLSRGSGKVSLHQALK